MGKENQRFAFYGKSMTSQQGKNLLYSSASWTLGELFELTRHLSRAVNLATYVIYGTSEIRRFQDTEVRGQEQLKNPDVRKKKHLFSLFQ